MPSDIPLSVTVTPVDSKNFPEFKNHKKALRIADPKTGLKGFIVIHNTNLGPAIGGTRYWYYETDDDALRDALRLSRAMTYKCAIAKVPFGGGKGVLMAERPDAAKTDEYLIAYVTAIGRLGEKFFTGEDVGLGEHDVEVLEAHSDRIVGRPEVGGLPARWAALSVFYAMESALLKRFGSASFEKKTIAVKGLGGVGLELCMLLENAGAKLIGGDVNETRVALAKKRHPGIKIVPPEKIHKERATVYAPCALGDEFNKQTIPELSVDIICGAANNQLATEEDGMRLFRKSILYVPDYVANAGGLVSVADELHEGGYSRERVEKKILELKETVEEIIAISVAEKKPTNVVADKIAEKRFLKK